MLKVIPPDASSFNAPDVTETASPQSSGLMLSSNIKSGFKVIASKPDLILLDNMSPELCGEAVSVTAGALKLEASGGITFNNAKAYANSGVNYLAIGSLTHSAPALDIGLDFRKGK